MGPRVRARHPKEAAAPLTVARCSGDGTVLVILTELVSEMSDVNFETTYKIAEQVIASPIDSA